MLSSLEEVLKLQKGSQPYWDFVTLTMPQSRLAQMLYAPPEHPTLPFTIHTIYHYFSIQTYFAKLPIIIQGRQEPHVNCVIAVIPGIRTMQSITSNLLIKWISKWKTSAKIHMVWRITENDQGGLKEGEILSTGGHPIGNLKREKAFKKVANVKWDFIIWILKGVMY